MLRGDDAGLGAVSSPLARQHGSPSSASEIVNVGEQRSASPGIEQFPHLQQIHTKVQQFPRLAQLRAADVWERNMVNRALTQDPAGVVEDSPRGVGDGGHGSPLSTSGQSDAEAYGSEGPYFSENECSRNSSSRRLFHTVHGGNSFVNGSDTNTSVDFGGAGSDGNLIPSGSGRRRRNQRGNNSRKLLRLGSDFSSKALSLANPMNIVSAVQSTQSPNLRRHVVAAERLEKQFPYRPTAWTPPGSKKDLTKALPNLGMGVWSPFRKGKQKTPSSARKMWNRMFPHGIVARDPRAARVAAWEIVLIFSFSALIITVPVRTARFPNQRPPCFTSNAGDCLTRPSRYTRPAKGALPLPIGERVITHVTRSERLTLSFLGIRWSWRTSTTPRKTHGARSRGARLCSG